MKKNIGVFLIAMAGLLCNCSDNYNFFMYSGHYNFKNKVKKCTETKYVYEDDKRTFDEEHVYDLDYSGNFISHVIKDKNGVIKTFNYDFYKKENSYIGYEIISNDRKVISKKIVFDSEKRKVKDISYRDGKVQFLDEYYYDSNGSIYKIYGSHNGFVTTSYFEFYKDASIRKDTIKGLNNKVIERIYNYYDNDQRIIKKETFNQDNDLDLIATYNYFKDKHEIKEINSFGQVTFHSITILEDNLPKKIITQENQYVTGTFFKSTEEFTYDKNKNVIKKIYAVNSGSGLIEIEYDYIYYDLVEDTTKNDSNLLTGEELIRTYYKYMSKEETLEKAYELSTQKVDYKKYYNWYKDTTAIKIETLKSLGNNKYAIKVKLYEGEKLYIYNVTMTTGENKILESISKEVSK